MSSGLTTSPIATIDVTLSVPSFTPPSMAMCE
jgi:hypothetical protein